MGAETTPPQVCFHWLPTEKQCYDYLDIFYADDNAIYITSVFILREALSA